MSPLALRANNMLRGIDVDPVISLEFVERIYLFRRLHKPVTGCDLYLFLLEECIR